MTEQLSYAMSIAWSDEDGVFVVTVPELPGCRTHGGTYEEAARQSQDAIESWLDAQRASGRPVPKSTLRLSDVPDPLAFLPIDAEEAAAQRRDLEDLRARYGLPARPVSV